MAKIHIENGIISSSADYSLYHGTSPLATVEAGGFRVQGDIIAENMIVSSSTTYMTTSFSAGSTAFGDTTDDLHHFTGSLSVSGASAIANSGQDPTAILSDPHSTGSYGLHVRGLNKGIRFDRYNSDGHVGAGTTIYQNGSDWTVIVQNNNDPIGDPDANTNLGVAVNRLGGAFYPQNNSIDFSGYEKSFTRLGVTQLEMTNNFTFKLGASNSFIVSGSLIQFTPTEKVSVTGNLDLSGNITGSGNLTVGSPTTIFSDKRLRVSGDGVFSTANGAKRAVYAEGNTGDGNYLYAGMEGGDSEKLVKFGAYLNTGLSELGYVGVRQDGNTQISGHLSGSGAQLGDFSSTKLKLGTSVLHLSEDNVTNRNNLALGIQGVGMLGMVMHEDTSFRAAIYFDHATDDAIRFDLAGGARFLMPRLTNEFSGSAQSTGSFGNVHVGSRLGIGTTSPAYHIDILNPSDSAVIRLQRTSYTAGLIEAGSVSMNIQTTNNFPIRFITNGTEAVRVDTSQRTFIGDQHSLNFSQDNATATQLQIATTTNSTHQFGQVYTNIRSEPAGIFLGRHAGTSINRYKLHQDSGSGAGTNLGNIGWLAYSEGGGGPTMHNAARISVTLEDNPSTNTAPGTINFNTMESYANDATSPKTRMSIHGGSKAGDVSIYSGSLILTGNDSGNVSGSSTSTGSFGNIKVGDNTAQTNRLIMFAGDEGFKIGYAQSGFLAHDGQGSDGVDAEISMTGTGGSAPFDQHGSIVYKTRAVNTKTRSSHIFYTGRASAERVRIDHEGKVGIGTASPAQPLDVKADASSAVGLQISYRAAGDARSILRLNNNATSWDFNAVDSSLSIQHSTDGTALTLSNGLDATFGGNISGSSASTASFGRLILPSGVLADKSAPHLAFGDGNTGFYEAGDNVLSIAIAGNRRWYFAADTIYGQDSGGPALFAKTATATQPVYSFEGDGNTGIGKASADNLSLITAGKESLRVSSTLVSGSSTTTGSFGFIQVEKDNKIEFKGSSDSTSISLRNTSSNLLTLRWGANDRIKFGNGAIYVTQYLGSNIPSYTFDGMTNYGMAGGSNAISLMAAGAHALTIDSSQNITLKQNKNFGSETYSSGFGGSGYRFGLDSNNLYQGEFDNLFVRGRMTIYELLINQIRASNGAIYVSDAAKVDSVTKVDSTTFRLTFDTGEGYGHPFVGGDLLKAQRFNGSGTYVSRLQVTAINGTTGLTASLTSGDTPPSGGFEFVRVGNTASSSRQGAIYLTNSDSGAPFIDIYDGVSSHAIPTGSQYLKVRTGRLDGISSPQLGTLSGYGFYASGSAYLEGTINATAGGKIGGWEISSSFIAKDNLRLDSANTKFIAGNGGLDNTGSNIRAVFGLFDGSNYGMRVWDGTNTYVRLSSDGNNQIANWHITPTTLFNTGSNGGLIMDASNKKYIVTTGSKADSEIVVMGQIASNKFGIRGNDTAGNLLFKLGMDGNEIAGWGITQTTISSSDGNVQIDSGNSRFLIKSGSGERVRMGLLNNNAQYGISGSDENGNLLFKLGDAGNEIAGWEIAPGNLQFDDAAGSVALSATSQSLQIFTGSVDFKRPKVVVGQLPLNDGTTDKPYGFAVFSGSQGEIVSGSLDAASVVITKNIAKLAGWELVPGQLKSGTVADINGNQASIALGGGSSGRNALTANATPTDGLFFVSASSNPVFYVGSTFSYVNNELKAAGWTLNTTSLTSPGGNVKLAAISSTSNYLGIGTTAFSGSGIFIGQTGSGKYQLSAVGNAGKMLWDNEKLEVQGADGTSVFKTTSTGATIGGFHINADSIRSGDSDITDSANQFVYIRNADDSSVIALANGGAVSMTRTSGDGQGNVGGIFLKGDGTFRLGKSNGQRIENDGSNLIMSSSNFFLGGGSQFVSGSNGKIEISSSNFHLDNAGNVDMTGTVTANAGQIGGWGLSSSAISASNVFLTSSINQAGLVITDGTDTILSVVSSSGLTDTNDLTGSKGSSPDAQFEDNEFELGSNGNAITAASRWSQESIRWDTDAGAGHGSQPNWLKDTDNARIFPQCAELPSGTVINASSFGTEGYAAFFRDIPVTDGLVEVSAFLRPFDWKYYGEKSGINAYCEMQITGSDNATFSSGTQTPFKPQRVLYTSKEPTRVGIRIKNKSLISSMRIKFISVHDLSRTRAKSYTLGGWTVDGLKIVGISGNPGSGGTRARTKPLVELNQQGMLLYSSKDSFIQLDEGGLEMKGNIQATDIDAQGSVVVTGSLTSNSELNIQGAVNFSTDVALSLGHTNPESKIHVSESFFNGTADNQIYPDSFPIGQDVSWLKAPSGSYPDKPTGYAGDGSDPYHVGSVFRAQFDPFISDNATTGQYGFLAAYGTGHIHDSYGRTQNHMMYGELITGGYKGFVGRGNPGNGADGTKDFRMSASIGIGKVWSYNSNKNQYGSDVRFAYGPSANNVGGMRQVGHRVTLLASDTTIDNVDDIPGGSTFYNQGFQVNRGGTINVDVDSSTGATTLGGFSAFAAYNNSDGTYGSSAGYGFWISGFSKNYISGKLGINDATPSYDIDVAGDIRTTGEGYFEGGVHVGGTTDPGDDNLVVDGNITANGNIIGDGSTSLTSMNNGTFAGTGSFAYLKVTPSPDTGHIKIAEWDANDDYVAITGDDWASADYALMIGVNGSNDGVTFISAKDTKPVKIRGGGNDSGNEIIVYDSGTTNRIDYDTTTNYFNGALGVGTSTPTTAGLIRATNDVVAFYSSDKRLKDNLIKIGNPLDKISQLNGYEFDWIAKEGIHENEGHDVGVIAQEVEKVLPEVVQTRESGYKAVKYEKIVPLLIEGIKEQQEQIEELKKEVEELKNGSSK